MTYRHHMTLDGHYIALDIMDTAGKVSNYTCIIDAQNENVLDKRLKLQL